MVVYLVLVQNLENKFQYVMDAFYNCEDAENLRKELNKTFTEKKQAKLAYIEIYQVK